MTLNDLTPAQALIRLSQALKARHMTVNEMSAMLGRSRRQVYRLLNQLDEIGTRVEVKRTEWNRQYWGAI